MAIAVNSDGSGAVWEGDNIADAPSGFIEWTGSIEDAYNAVIENGAARVQTQADIDAKEAAEVLALTAPLSAALNAEIAASANALDRKRITWKYMTPEMERRFYKWNETHGAIKCRPGNAFDMLMPAVSQSRPAAADYLRDEYARLRQAASAIVMQVEVTFTNTPAEFDADAAAPFDAYLDSRWD